MELQHLESAIEDCTNGLVPFNNGLNLYCFLYGKTWFPITSVLNYASQLANENIEYTTNKGIVELHKLLPYVRVKTVHVQNNQLVDLTTEEALTKIRNLADVIKSLT